MVSVKTENLGGQEYLNLKSWNVSPPPPPIPLETHVDLMASPQVKLRARADFALGSPPPLEMAKNGKELAHCPSSSFAIKDSCHRPTLTSGVVPPSSFWTS